MLTESVWNFRAHFHKNFPELTFVQTSSLNSFVKVFHIPGVGASPVCVRQRQRGIVFCGCFFYLPVWQRPQAATGCLPDCLACQLGVELFVCPWVVTSCQGGAQTKHKRNKYAHRTL